jgi:predicted transcriptional regulator of viral defense system
MPDRLDSRRSLNENAFRQAGYFTAHQAKEAGFTAQSQKYHADRGSWVRIDRGLYRLAEWPSHEFDPYSRWYTWSEARGVISHASAAVIHAIGDLNPREVHLTRTGEHRTRLTGVVLHSGDLADEDINARDTFRVTTPTRTVLDLADSAITQEQFTALVTDAADRSLIDVETLARRADDFGPQAALRIERALSAHREQTVG